MHELQRIVLLPLVMEHERGALLRRRDSTPYLDETFYREGMSSVLLQNQDVLDGMRD